MSGIILSKKFGVNPTLTYCPRCGGESQEILLVGNAQEYQCTSCKKSIIGKKPKECPFCGSVLIIKIGPFDGTRTKLPATDVCDKCKENLAELKSEIEKGGVPWRCSDCKAEGVIKHDTDIAIEFKKLHPEMAALTLSKKTCPACNEGGANKH